MIDSADNGTPFTDTSTETVNPTTPATPKGSGSTSTPTTSSSSDPASEGDGVITANGIPCVN
jgi:hypothetical protein